MLSVYSGILDWTPTWTLRNDLAKRVESDPPVVRVAFLKQTPALTAMNKQGCSVCLILEHEARGM